MFTFTKPLPTPYASVFEAWDVPLRCYVPDSRAMSFAHGINTILPGSLSIQLRDYPVHFAVKLTEAEPALGLEWLPELFPAGRVWYPELVPNMLTVTGFNDFVAAEYLPNVDFPDDERLIFDPTGLMHSVERAHDRAPEHRWADSFWEKIFAANGYCIGKVVRVRRIIGARFVHAEGTRWALAGTMFRRAE